MNYLDNQIHIAHNVRIGNNSIIAGQVGIAGSSVIGNNVKIGGQAGISGHLKIGDNVLKPLQCYNKKGPMLF